MIQSRQNSLQSAMVRSAEAYTETLDLHVPAGVDGELCYVAIKVGNITPRSYAPISQWLTHARAKSST